MRGTPSERTHMELSIWHVLELSVQPGIRQQQEGAICPQWEVRDDRRSLDFILRLSGAIKGF